MSKVPSQLCACKLVLGNKVRVWYSRNDTAKFQLFSACDHDFDLMTLLCEIYLDMVVTYLYAKNKVSRSKSSKVIIWTDRQTDTHTYKQTCICKAFTYPLTRAANINRDRCRYQPIVNQEMSK